MRYPAPPLCRHLMIASARWDRHDHDGARPCAQLEVDGVASIWASNDPPRGSSSSRRGDSTRSQSRAAPERATLSIDTGWAEL